MSMFCFQCQETAHNTGCTIKGVCGKTAEVAAIENLLVFVTKGIAVFNHELRQQGKTCVEADFFIFNALFVTITNANFDFRAIERKVEEGLLLRDRLYRELGSPRKEYPEACTWTGAKAQFLEKAATVGVLATTDEDIRSLKELTMYGLKGLAAYVEHAYNLNKTDDEVLGFISRALSTLTYDKSSVDELIALVLETGKYGTQGMALLDGANTGRFGIPEMTRVNIGVSNRPGILISGHDLRDIEELLEQTEEQGVDVYTHCEMLPAHYYPKLKKYKHLVGNYGGAWWQQREDFESFNGPILFTTNCIVPPFKNATYLNRIFTTGATGLEGAKYIPERKSGKQKDFSELIALAKTCLPPKQIETGTIIGGFAHDQVLALKDQIVDAVKSGAIRKFVVMAGCDGRMNNRNYYTDFAKALPKDTVILTAGCAKFRYNKLELGSIGAIPRVLDAGQCNDSYSLAIIALRLKEIFEVADVNDLPIAFNIAWYEQKAVIVLLALLYLGFKNVHIGPTLPAFLSPNVAQVLVKNFGLSGITTVEEDMKALI